MITLLSLQGIFEILVGIKGYLLVGYFCFKTTSYKKQNPDRRVGLKSGLCVGKRVCLLISSKL